MAFKFQPQSKESRLICSRLMSSDAVESALTQTGQQQIISRSRASETIGVPINSLDKSERGDIPMLIMTWKKKMSSHIF